MAPVRWSPDGRSVAYVVAAKREDDPTAGLWVNDFKNPPRQIFKGWVDWWLVRGPGNDIYFLEAKPDLNGVLCKIGWNGAGLTRTSATIPMIQFLLGGPWTKLTGSFHGVAGRTLRGVPGADGGGGEYWND